MAQGEFVTILGPSGSGKTTLLSLIAGLNRPTAGRIFIGGRDVTDAPAQQRNIGLVFQSYALFPHMTVLENVLFPLGVRKIGGAAARSQALDALKLVRLDGLQDRRPSQLSGGQQQRVALARAIVFKPDILLLDEPLGALDRKLREELQVELKQLQRTLGVTTLLVTHDQEEALSLSDRIMVLDKGRTQQVAAPAEAYLRPANRFVAEFLGIANFVGLADGRTGLVRPERVRVGADGHQWRTSRRAWSRRSISARWCATTWRWRLARRRRWWRRCRSSAGLSPRATRSRCRGIRPISGRWLEWEDNRGGGDERGVHSSGGGGEPAGVRHPVGGRRGRSRRRSA